jgi:uncharacterized membrane protein YkoI
MFVHVSLTARLAIAALLLAGWSAAAAEDGDREVCFSQGEMRELEAQKTIIPSVAAVRAARSAAGSGKVVRAALCRRGGDYYYKLSVLRRDGRVLRVTVEGRSGKVETGRQPN